MKKPETRLQVRIQLALRAEFPGSYWNKIHGSPFQNAGAPDLYGCVEGLFFGFEVKIPGNDLDPLQKIHREAIIRADGVCEKVTSPEEAIKLVRARLNGRSR